jgi:hypothetical protein
MTQVQSPAANDWSSSAAHGVDEVSCGGATLSPDCGLELGRGQRVGEGKVRVDTVILQNGRPAPTRIC